jgi:hypothetical protein
MNDNIIYVFVDAENYKSLIHFLKTKFMYDGFKVTNVNLNLGKAAPIPYDFVWKEKLTDEGKRYIDLFSEGEIDPQTGADISSWMVSARLDKIFTYIEDKNYDNN